jgi:signal transduction histidine kinase
MSSASVDVVAMVGTEADDRDAERARSVYLQELYGALADERAARQTAERTVSAFKELLAEKTRACSDASQAVHLRDDFMAAVAHDLKNPVSAILLIASRLQRTSDEDRTRRMGDSLVRAAHHLDDLITGLQDLARMRNGREPAMKREAAPLAGLLCAAADLLAPIAEQRGARIDVRCKRDRDQMIWVACDPTQIARVLSNLLGNAIRFTPVGEAIVVSAEATMDLNGGEVTVAVTDRGPGIPPEHLPHLFDPYWSGWPEHGTLGLGLAITRAIVASHGGRIWVESAPGEGSRFAFTLPMTSGARL